MAHIAQFRQWQRSHGPYLAHTHQTSFSVSSGLLGVAQMEPMLSAGARTEPYVP